MSDTMAGFLDRLRRQDESPSLYLGAYQALKHKGHDSEALDVLEQGVQAFPESADLALTLGRALLEMGADNRAIESLENAARLVCPDPSMFELMAQVYKQQGRKENAVLAYRVHVAYQTLLSRLQPRRAQVDAPPRPPRPPTASEPSEETFETETMAELYIQQGKWAQAERIYRRLSENAPDEERYREKLREIAASKEVEKQQKTLDTMTRIMKGMQEESET